jgi:hypothetical protein
MLLNVKVGTYFNLQGFVSICEHEYKYVIKTSSQFVINNSTSSRSPTTWNRAQSVQSLSFEVKQ